MVIIVMGVAGTGKTTVGSRLARELEWPFHDADDYHALEDMERMRSGVALTDVQRMPWLIRLAALIGDHVRAQRSMVLACSALKRSYRRTLLSEVDDPRMVHLVLLRADEGLLTQRLAERRSHFFPPDLLPTQLAALELPDEATDAPVLMVDAAQPLGTVVATIRQALRI